MHTENKAKKLIRFGGLLLLVLLVFNLMPAQPAYAATIVVNSTADNLTAGDGLCTLREAITNANNDSDSTSGDCVTGSGADIVTVPSGNYILTLANLATGENDNATGDLDIRDDLTIQGAAARSTIIDGNGNGSAAGSSDRVFHIPFVSGNPNIVTLNDITVRNGDTVSGQFGGGILVDPTNTLNVNRSSIRDNVATSAGGGGIMNYGATVVIRNSTIRGNLANGNDAQASSFRGMGGGVYASNELSPAITNITNSTISENFSTNHASAMALISSTNFVLDTTLDNVTISGNQANANSTTVGDAAVAAGGPNPPGTYYSPVVNMNRTLLTGNILFGTTTPTGCTIFPVAAPPPANTIFMMNNYNVVGSNANNVGCPASGTDIVPVSGTMPANILSPLADNGGPTDTNALVNGSPANPAIDAAPSADCNNPPVDGIDQRGAARNFDGSPSTGECDSGAYEVREAITMGDCGSGSLDGTTQNFVFSSGNTVSIDIPASPSSGLMCITVEEMGTNHLKATGPGTNGVALMTGDWWYITGNVNSGFDVSMTLPYTGADVNSRVCKWPGNNGGGGWDCAGDPENTPGVNNVTRTGITSFSDWAVGDNVDPTAVNLQSFSTSNQPVSLVVVLIVGMLLLGFGSLWLRRRVDR